MRGAGEILLTSIDRDGTRSGFDCELTAAVSSRGVDSGHRLRRRRHVRSLRRGLYLGPRRCRARRVDLSFLGARRCRVEGIHPGSRRARFGSDIMLIPSIDLQGGRVVQLVQGERLAIASDDIDGWIRRFSHFDRVQLIDLDAAKSGGGQRAAGRDDLRNGFRAAWAAACDPSTRAATLLERGARKVIVGSALFRGDRPDLELGAGAAPRRSATTS